MFWTTQKYDPAAETPDLSGKVAIVTGGNAGVGYESVKHLASHGAKVYLAARSEQRATEAIAKLRQEGAFGKGGSVEFLHVDLSCLKDVKTAAEQLVQKEPKIHVLLNSAGMLAQDQRTVTPEGIVDTLATNHFGHFVFTNALLPSLKSAASEPNSDVRIVVMASESYKFAPTIGKIDSLADLDVCKEKSLVNAMKRYGTSKLCNIWYTRELQKRLDAENANILVIAVDPGAVASPGSRGSLDNGLWWPLPQIIWPVLRAIMSTPAVGAISSQFATTSTKVLDHRASYKSAYILPPNKITPVEGQAADEGLAGQLWAMSEKVVQEVQDKGGIDY